MKRWKIPHTPPVGTPAPHDPRGSSLGRVSRQKGGTVYDNPIRLRWVAPELKDLKDLLLECIFCEKQGQLLPKHLLYHWGFPHPSRLGRNR